ncbi:GNAT family N-acetyltransferase [Planctomonas sp. JC2975]|uniref:GNAT family N-acetyltransferase n=1 Tax=Planctomonas sp. JC2975 TaxID=2729626 RepID=UPI001475BB77|nr:GNAT family N-acetyltransferase [Planctomonas sp. JC2975]NNC12190.1 GNAT family N-acetyltransferase [Planctomonas sp. JC2975]
MPESPSTITIGLESPYANGIEELLRLGAEYSLSLYPPEECFLLTPAELDEPGVRLFVARDDAGGALAMGALVARHDEGELKRMFVHPDSRRLGLASRILTRIEDAAMAQGLPRLVLETGPLHDAALAFYRRHGYVPIPRFGPYVGSPSSVCFAKELGAS